MITTPLPKDSETRGTGGERKGISSPACTPCVCVCVCLKPLCHSVILKPPFTSVITLLLDRKQLTMPSLRMFEDQCKADRDGADSDASSSEPPTGRDATRSPLGADTSPLRFSRPSRGKMTCCFLLDLVDQLVFQQWFKSFTALMLSYNHRKLLNFPIQWSR